MPDVDTRGRLQPPEWQQGTLRCPQDKTHQLLIVRCNDETLLAACIACPVVTPATDIGRVSSPWYDSHQNLDLLVDWLGHMTPSSVRGVLGRPLSYEEEYRTALAARDHEWATSRGRDAHTVYKGGSDVDAYCNDCAWRCHAGVVVNEPAGSVVTP